ERNDVRALEAMLACGFDPNRPDAGIGKTVLHSAAMEGWPEAVRVLLAHGASVHVRDREVKGPPLIWAAEGSRQGLVGRGFAAVFVMCEPTEAGQSVAYFSFARWNTQASCCASFANFALAWNSMFTSASGRCSGASVLSARGMPWSKSIMSCWIMPSHLGSSG